MALAAGYFGWLRDSSLVAVEHVEVRGVAGDGSDEIVHAITTAAEGMTTLHMQPQELEAAVARFPTVAGIQADPDFPHGLTVTVAERRPALVAGDGTNELAVAGDGTVLPGVDFAKDELPRIAVSELPQEGRLTGEALQEAIVIGAAPPALRALIEDASYRDDDGVTLRMTGDVELRFGDASAAGQKWRAAAAVLADPKLTTVSYIDLRVARRPAVGGTGDGAAPSG